MRQIQHNNQEYNRGDVQRSANQHGRIYESSGPGVRIRGTAQTVAEKYLKLAQDAHSSGDPVMAESYLQHAEHYFRILAAARRGELGLTRPGDQEADQDGDFAPLPDRFNSPPGRSTQPTPFQPRQRTALSRG